MLLPEKDLFEKIKFIFNGISQKEIAKKLNVSTSLVTKWNKGEGRPTLETLQKVIGISGCSWDELLTGCKAKRVDDELLNAKDEIIAGLKRELESKAKFESSLERENGLLREKLAILESAGASGIREQQNKSRESAG